MPSPDVLPDCRAKSARGLVSTRSGTWAPVFCANCGVEGGLCPENSTFIFWLCTPCFETKGPITGLMVVPDHEFYQKMAHEQQETFGRPATHNELLQVVSEDASPLARLMKEARR